MSNVMMIILMDQKRYISPYIEVLKCMPEAFLAKPSHTEQDHDADAKEFIFFDEVEGFGSLWDEPVEEEGKNDWGI
jgi:hypothetical protein